MAEGMHGANKESNASKLGAGGSPSSGGEGGAKLSQLKLNLQRWVARTRVYTERVWGVDRKLVGGRRHSQLRTRKTQPVET